MYNVPHSIQVEKHVLGGILKYPEVFSEIDGFVSEYDFYTPAHKTVFSVMKSVLSNGGNLDKVILAQKIKDLGISFKDDINIFDYIENLSFTQITPKATFEACQELVKLRIRRELIDNAVEVQDFIQKNGSKNIDEIVRGVDAIYNKQINQYTEEQAPTDLYSGISELIYNAAENPVEDTGLITPFPLFNYFFGGIRAGSGLYAVVSRAKQGKSSWLLKMAEGCVKCNPNVKVLILDTEMSTKTSQYRAASALTQIPMWHLETGNWRKNTELTKKTKNLNTEIYHGRIYHMQVANKPIEEICSIIRRWFYKNVGRGNPAMVVYDYIKLTGEKLSESWKEYQAIGEKINHLNEVSNKLNLQLFTAMQLNRSAEKGVDDSSAIALSDRLQWFAAFVAIFRKKRLEEIAEYGENFGSHMLIPIATRFQGQGAMGHQDFLRIDLGKDKYKYVQNFINYHIENFDVTEKGSLKDIINAHTGKIDLRNDHADKMDDERRKAEL